jgi:hypothetical protein
MGLEEVLNLEGEETEHFPLETQCLKSVQNADFSQDKKLQQEMTKKNPKYGWTHQYGGVRLIAYKDKLYIPKNQQAATFNWYHHFLCHPGGERLANTIGAVCKWPGLTHEMCQ